MRFKKVRSAMLIFVTGSTLALFQNCSGVGFQNTPGATASLSSQSVGCGNQLQVGGACIDFACKSVVELDAASLLNVPARTVDGVCYAVKVINGVTPGISSLTSTRDADVMAADHDTAVDNNNPYEMGSLLTKFSLNGPRVVKLAGGLDAVTPINVDNFILYGVYPENSPLNDYAQFYQAQGSSDSGLRINGVATASIFFHDQAIPLQPFATGGISALAPINIALGAQANVVNILDLRDEDCGGSRAMSDVYLLFQ